jgi:hypothetical protein
MVSLNVSITFSFGALLLVAANTGSVSGGNTAFSFLGCSGLFAFLRRHCLPQGFAANQKKVNSYA